MTLRYHRGMSLGAFQDMIAAHHREQDERTGRRAPAEVYCDHPFEQAGLGVTAHKVDAGIEIRAGYQCPACGTKWGLKRLLRSRKVQT